MKIGKIRWRKYWELRIVQWTSVNQVRSATISRIEGISSNGNLEKTREESTDVMGREGGVSPRLESKWIWEVSNFFPFPFFLFFSLFFFSLFFFPSWFEPLLFSPVFLNSLPDSPYLSPVPLTLRVTEPCDEDRKRYWKAFVLFGEAVFQVWKSIDEPLVDKTLMSH